MLQEEEDKEFYTLINLFFKMMFWLLSITLVMSLGYFIFKLFLNQ